MTKLAEDKSSINFCLVYCNIYIILYIGGWRPVNGGFSSISMLITWRLRHSWRPTLNSCIEFVFTFWMLLVPGGAQQHFVNPQKNMGYPPKRPVQMKMNYNLSGSCVQGDMTLSYVLHFETYLYRQIRVDSGHVPEHVQLLLSFWCLVLCMHLRLYFVATWPSMYTPTPPPKPNIL